MVVRKPSINISGVRVLICLYTQCTIGLGIHFVSSLAVFVSLRFIQGIFIQVNISSDNINEVGISICLYTQCTIGLGIHFDSSLAVFVSLRFIQGIFIQVNMCVL